MGERKGTNKYYPPDFDPKKHASLDAYHGTHALRERANKLHMGILIIRFEMPYNIWCEGCGQHVGMGVRYNAEKTKVGMYYTTPIYQFRMKCTMCDNHYVIKTDPKNLDYEIVSGARRQERRWDSTQNGQVVPDLKETTNRLFDDAMFKLEHGDADKEKKKDAEPRIRDLAEIQDRVRDDYLANRILRDDFRVKKKADKAQKVVDDALRQKASLDIELVPEHKDDIKTASLIKFQASETSEERQSRKRASIEEESVFKTKSRKVFRAKEGAASKKEKSRKNLVGLVNQHRIKTAIEKTTANPLRNIGVVLRRTSSKSESSDPEPGPSSTSCSSPSTESSRSEALETSGLGSLCDYGSTSSDSD